MSIMSILLIFIILTVIFVLLLFIGILIAIFVPQNKKPRKRRASSVTATNHLYGSSDPDGTSDFDSFGVGNTGKKNAASSDSSTSVSPSNDHSSDSSSGG